MHTKTISKLKFSDWNVALWIILWDPRALQYTSIFITLRKLTCVIIFVYLKNNHLNHCLIPEGLGLVEAWLRSPKDLIISSILPVISCKSPSSNCNGGTPALELSPKSPPENLKIQGNLNNRPLNTKKYNCGYFKT